MYSPCCLSALRLAVHSVHDRVFHGGESINPKVWAGPRFKLNLEWMGCYEISNVTTECTACCMLLWLVKTACTAQCFAGSDRSRTCSSKRQKQRDHSKQNENRRSVGLSR